MKREKGEQWRGVKREGGWRRENRGSRVMRVAREKGEMVEEDCRRNERGRVEEGSWKGKGEHRCG